MNRVLSFLWAGVRPMLIVPLWLLGGLIGRLLILVAGFATLLAIVLLSQGQPAVAFRLILTGWLAGVVATFCIYVRSRILGYE